MAYAPTFPKYEDQEDQQAIDHPGNNASPIQYQQQPQPSQAQSLAFILLMEGHPEAMAYVMFGDKSRRKKFVGNVLLAVGFQLVICACCIVACLALPQIGRDFFRTPGGQSLASLSIILFSILHISIACCGVGRGKPNPCNILLFLISTVLLSVFAASITVQYHLVSIVIAGATTAAVVYVLAMITLFTKIDITDKAMYLLGAFVTLIVFGFIAGISFSVGWIPLDRAHQVLTVFSALVALLYVFLILHQLQLIVGGRKYQYTEDDWLLASISLFFDILMLFLKLLELGGERN